MSVGAPDYYTIGWRGRVLISPFKPISRVSLVALISIKEWFKLGEVVGPARILHVMLITDKPDTEFKFRVDGVDEVFIIKLSDARNFMYPGMGFSLQLVMWDEVNNRYHLMVGLPFEFYDKFEVYVRNTVDVPYTPSCTIFLQRFREELT